MENRCQMEGMSKREEISLGCASGETCKKSEIYPYYSYTTVTVHKRVRTSEGKIRLERMYLYNIYNFVSS